MEPLTTDSPRIRTHGYDFVDEHGDILATAATLADIGSMLDTPAVKSKLADSRLSVQFYRVSRQYKGFQVPDGITCDAIVTTFESELAERGFTELDVNFDNY